MQGFVERTGADITPPRLGAYIGPAVFLACPSDAALHRAWRAPSTTVTATAVAGARSTYGRQAGEHVPRLPGLNRRRSTLVGWFRLDRNFVGIRVLALRLNLAALMAAHTGRNELVRELGEGGGARVGVR